MWFYAMKFKDIFISVFLAGLLGYAICHRAGLVGNPDSGMPVTSSSQETHGEAIRYGNWIFAPDPQEGLTVRSHSGRIIHRLPEIRAERISIETAPDTAKGSLGLLHLRSNCGALTSCFRILPGEMLELVSI